MNSRLTSESSSIQDVESWNHRILGLRLEDIEPDAFDRQIERSLAATFDPEKAFDDLSSSCSVLHCSSYFPVQ